MTTAMTPKPRRKRKGLGDELEDVVSNAGRELWGWRWELTAVAVVYGPIALVWKETWQQAAWGIAAVAAIAWQTDRVREWERRQRWRRKWLRAMFAVELARDGTGGKKGTWGPRVKKVDKANAGHVLEVQVPPGLSGGVLESKKGAIETALEVRLKLVEGDNPSRWIVALQERDPFDMVETTGWPNRSAGMLSGWDDIPMAMNENGVGRRVRLVERHLILGGEPGSGKSGAINLICAQIALDPESDMWLVDGKTVELGAWRSCAKDFIGPDLGKAIESLKKIQGVMETRYRELRAQGLRKIQPGKGHRLQWVIIDELAMFTNHWDKDLKKEFNLLLTDLVARGRAAGVIVIAATQKPGSEVVPTFLRDLFGFRLALACNTPQASDTILGQGWASAGADSTKIPKSAKGKGVGYLLAEEGVPEKIRCYWLSDDEIREIASRAAKLRLDSEWSGGLAELERPDVDGAEASEPDDPPEED